MFAFDLLAARAIGIGPIRLIIQWCRDERFRLQLGFSYDAHRYVDHTCRRLQRAGCSTHTGEPFAIYSAFYRFLLFTFFTSHSQSGDARHFCALQVFNAYNYNKDPGVTEKRDVKRTRSRMLHDPWSCGPGRLEILSRYVRPGDCVSLRREAWAACALTGTALGRKINPPCDTLPTYHKLRLAL